MNKAEKDQECDATNAAHSWVLAGPINAMAFIGPAVKLY
jgi:hypothetical protein